MVDNHLPQANPANEVAIVNPEQVMIDTKANSTQVAMTQNHAICLASQQSVMDNLQYKMQVALTRLTLKENQQEEAEIKGLILSINKRMSMARTEFS